MYTIQKFANCGSSLLKSSGCDDGIPEQLKCPICYEVPSAEIFQCKNGHTICNRCLASVQQCPQCRIPFRVDGELIRVRALESLLDSMMVPCPYKSGGCVEIISRKQLKDHVINCVHNGKCIQLCKNLGYHCDFWTNAMNSKSAVDHFHHNHKAIIVHGDGAFIKIDNLKATADDMKMDAFWTPLIFALSGGNHLMVLTFLNDADKSVSWTCLKLSQDELPRMAQQGFEVQFRINSQSEKMPMLKWKIPTISVVDATEVLKFPMCRFPIDGLVKYYVGKKDGTLKIDVSVHNNRNIELSNANGAIGNIAMQLTTLTIGDIHPRNGSIGIRKGETSVPVWPRLSNNV